MFHLTKKKKEEKFLFSVYEVVLHTGVHMGIPVYNGLSQTDSVRGGSNMVLYKVQITRSTIYCSYLYVHVATVASVTMF